MNDLRYRLREDLPALFDDDDDAGEFRDLVRVILDTMNADMEGLRRTLEAGDWESCRRTAHRIKGSAAEMREKRIYPLSRTLEERIRAGELEGNEPLVAGIEERWQVLRRMMEEFLNEKGTDAFSK